MISASLQTGEDKRDCPGRDGPALGPPCCGIWVLRTRASPGLSFPIFTGSRRRGGPVGFLPSLPATPPISLAAAGRVHGKGERPLRPAWVTSGRLRWAR